MNDHPGMDLTGSKVGAVLVSVAPTAQNDDPVGLIM